MKLFYKLIIGFLIVASMSWITGYFANESSKEALTKASIENAEFFAVELLDGIEKGLDSKFEIFWAYTHDLTLQDAVFMSNLDFDKIDDVQSYIVGKDKEWTSVPMEEITPFMYDILNTRSSIELGEKIRFFDDNYGYRVFGEIFITNKYGAIVAMTNKTSDYKQDDEEWWQIARTDGKYVSNITFDNSANVYSIDFALPINDKAGHLIGVMKVVLNIESILNTIADVQMTWTQKGHKSKKFTILDNVGRIIYSTSDYKFLGDGSYLIPKSHFDPLTAHPNIYSELIKIEENGDSSVFVSHVHSTGPLGLDWILVVEQPAKELFAPAAKLRNRILVVSIVVTLLGILIGFIVSNAISKSVNKLKEATVKVGEGNLDVVVATEANDEIGDLAKSFQQMLTDLKITTVARDQLLVSEEKYRSLVTHIPDVVWTTDMSGTTFFISPNVHEVYGYTPEEIYNRSDELWFGRIHPDDIEKVKENFRLLFEMGQPLDVEYRIQRKDGEWIWLQDKSIGTYEKDSIKRADGVFVDITKRKVAEILLKESEAKLKSLYSSMTEGVCLHEIIYDDSGKAVDYKIIDVNPAYEKITGLSREKAVGSIASELYGTEQPPYFDIYEKVAFSGEPASFETFFPPMQKHFSISMFSPEKGKFATVFEDISDRKQAENVLKESEQLISEALQFKESILKTSSVGVLTYDAAGQCVFANESLAEIIGTNVAGLLSQNFHQIQSWKRAGMYESAIKALSTGIEQQIETHVVTTFGKDVWLSVRFSSFLSKGEKHLLVFAYDITERKKIEEKLEYERKQLLSVFDSINEVIYVTDFETNEILFVNEYLKKLFGRDPTGGLCHKEFQGFDEPCDFCTNKIIKGLHGKPYQWEHHNPIINRSYLLTDRVIKWPDGRDVRFELAVDITERKRAEENLIKANKEIEQWSRELEKRVQEKTEELEKSHIQLVQSEKLSAMGQLSAGLAHELNSPLAGLLPLLEKYRKAVETDSEAYSDLTLMLSASEHMANIVRDFGSFARKPAKERSELSIEDIIESTLSFSSGDMEKYKIKIVKEYAEKIPKIIGKKTELQQVVLNIITNARDAMPDGGSFTIKTGIDGGKVKAEFTDNGVGISSENIGRVFDPFFTTKPQGMGVGLGLSISYGIIKNHGGDILVQSELKKGTTFTVLIPATVSKGETKDD